MVCCSLVKFSCHVRFLCFKTWSIIRLDSSTAAQSVLLLFFTCVHTEFGSFASSSFLHLFFFCLCLPSLMVALSFSVSELCMCVYVCSVSVKMLLLRNFTRAPNTNMGTCLDEFMMGGISIFFCLAFGYLTKAWLWKRREHRTNANKDGWMWKRTSFGIHHTHDCN